MLCKGMNGMQWYAMERTTHRTDQDQIPIHDLDLSRQIDTSSTPFTPSTQFRSTLTGLDQYDAALARRVGSVWHGSCTAYYDRKIEDLDDPDGDLSDLWKVLL